MDTLNSTIRSKSIHLEFGGNSPVLSISFEENFSLQKKIFGCRIGFGMEILSFRSERVYVPTLPIEGNVSFLEKAHHIEIGIGMTPFISKTGVFLKNEIYDFDMELDDNYSFNYLFISRIGYRFQRFPKKWIIKIAYTPIWFNSSEKQSEKLRFQHHYGISVGRILN